MFFALLWLYLFVPEMSSVLRREGGGKVIDACEGGCVLFISERLGGKGMEEKQMKEARCCTKKGLIKCIVAGLVAVLFLGGAIFGCVKIVDAIKAPKWQEVYNFEFEATVFQSTMRVDYEYSTRYELSGAEWINAGPTPTPLEESDEIKRYAKERWNIEVESVVDENMHGKRIDVPVPRGGHLRKNIRNTSLSSFKDMVPVYARISERSGGGNFRVHFYAAFQVVSIDIVRVKIDGDKISVRNETGKMTLNRRLRGSEFAMELEETQSKRDARGNLLTVVKSDVVETATGNVVSSGYTIRYFFPSGFAQGDYDSIPML
jgi:hypothetical protein